MNVLMVTNTYRPHVGGVARSVESFGAEFRRRGHRVLVVAPRFEGAALDEPDVVRIPAIQRFNGSDFSVPVPVPRGLRAEIDRFAPDVVHSHHPFLLGDTALRVAALRDLPVVFTHHTLYERYTHYVPGDSPRLKRFAIDLAIGYCNLCDAVIAPCESIEELLRERGVRTPVAVIPTGVEVDRFAAGDGARFRRAHGLPAEAFVVGHLGRLAPEKNLGFVADAVAAFVAGDPNARFLVAGEGRERGRVIEAFARRGLDHRLHLAGVLGGEELPGAYRAMDVFAFASQSETQGMVLVEAMAAGVPVVAVDAPGVREVVRDRVNGRLLEQQDLVAFVAALDWLRDLEPERRRTLDREVAATAESFSIAATAERALTLYASLRLPRPVPDLEQTSWAAARRRVAEEWRILRNLGGAIGEAASAPPELPDGGRESP